MFGVLKLKKLLFVLGVGLLFAVLLGVVAKRHTLACNAPSILGYQQIREDIFAVENMPTERSTKLVESISQAYFRISKMYGEPLSKPRLIVTDDSEKATRLGSNETAVMHRSPWRSCIVIGPRGQNTDVIAHEWLHAEVEHRVGFWRFIRQIPVWFDEGLALTVDFRAPFLLENIELPQQTIQAITSKDTAKAFFSGNVRQNYQAARVAVNDLIVQSSLYQDLERIAAGESFEQVFLQSAQQMGEKKHR